MCANSYLVFSHYEDISDSIVSEMMTLTPSHLAWCQQQTVTYDTVGYNLGCTHLDEAAARLSQAELAIVQLPF